MLRMLATAARALARHWPALASWILGGLIAHHLLLQLAGWAGTVSSLLGYLILPLAALARLTAYVAMLLVVRDRLQALTEVSPVPSGGRARRDEFVGALLAGILPFFAVYAAWGQLREDNITYNSITQAAISEMHLAALGGETPDTSGLGDDLALSPLVAAIILIALLARWAWKRWQARLPRWLAPLAVYFEALWVYLSVIVLSDLVTGVADWATSRQALAWFTQLRGWLGEHLAALAWIWDAAGTLLGAIAPVLLLPLAWLTIAGVIYGRAMTTDSAIRRARRLRSIRVRYRLLSPAVRARVNELGSSYGGRLKSIGESVLLMVRAGPVFIASYVLLYTLWLAAERLLTIALPHLFGPQEPRFWEGFLDLILLAVPVLLEPVRSVIVAAAFDETLRRGATSAVAIGASAAVVAVGGDAEAEGRRAER